MFVCFIALDSGGEETAKGSREAQTGLHQGRVSTGGVEMEERVSLHIVTSLLAFSRHNVCLVELSSFCYCVLQERRRDLPPAEEAWSFSGLEQSLFHYGSSKTPVTHVTHLLYHLENTCLKPVYYKSFCFKLGVPQGIMDHHHMLELNIDVELKRIG